MQETRLWNAGEGRTYSMRSKEQAHDYRYFPEPDLPPLIVSAEFLSETRKKLPELPEARRARIIAEYELSVQDAHTLTASREFADRFEAAARTARNPRRVANVLLSEVGGRLKALGLEQEQSPVSMADVYKRQGVDAGDSWPRSEFAVKSPASNAASIVVLQMFFRSTSGLHSERSWF